MPIPFDRTAMLGRLADEQFDLLVIGGGITGCGVALDAVARGLRVALVERHDFASGTSSKSSKLVHGGLRYLQQGDLRLVYEALHERQRLLHNAPHLVRVLPFLIPVLTRDKDGGQGPVSKKVAKALRSALWMYDLTGGLRIGKRHQRLDADAAHAHCPTLPVERLSSGFVYYDATTDDARLTLTIARTAARHGAVVANRCEVTELTHDATGSVDGAIVDAGINGDKVPIRIRARSVVSATGVWADRLRRLDEGTDPDSLRPAKGVHITIPWRLVGNDIAVIIAVPKDKRSLFLVPWGRRHDGTFEHCYVGTTDTDFSGELDQPQLDGGDLDYVLRALNHNLTTTVTAGDVTGVWAGLRPLVKSADSARTADLSRRHSVVAGDSGMISVTGGKLTTYRRMASDTVDEVIRALGRSGRSRTKRLVLLGGDRTDESGDARLHDRYGSLAAELRALIALDGRLAEPLVAGLPYTCAEAVYAVRCEMASTIDDVLAHDEPRAHLEDRTACLDSVERVAALLASELGWDTDETDRQIAAYRALCRAEVDAMRTHVEASS